MGGKAVLNEGVTQSGLLHTRKRHWFSGKILRCQRSAPGSIPGWRISAFVAQLAARRSHNPKVAGSTPVESIFGSYIRVIKERQKEFPNRELNPGLTGESRVS